MGYKKEGKKRRNYLKEFNNKVEEKQGFIFFMIFIVVLSIIPVASERLANFILMLDMEILAESFRYIFTVSFIVSYLSMLINHIKEKRTKRKEVSTWKNT